jgi:hypothetical protein
MDTLTRVSTVISAAIGMIMIVMGIGRLYAATDLLIQNVATYLVLIFLGQQFLRGAWALLDS